MKTKTCPECDGGQKDLAPSPRRRFPPRDVNAAVGTFDASIIHPRKANDQLLRLNLDPANMRCDHRRIIDRL